MNGDSTQSSATKDNNYGLCANGCGFYGNPATENLCSQCYREKQKKERPESSVIEREAQPEPPLLNSEQEVEGKSSVPIISEPDVAETDGKEAGEEAVKQVPGRCPTCSKKIGLLGFPCRCGLSFCSQHRYPDSHKCNFDFNSFERRKLEKANPRVAPEKIERL